MSEKDFERKLRDYVPQLVPFVPRLLDKISLDEWEKSLDIIYDRHIFCIAKSRIKTLEPFIDDFMEFLTSADRDLIEYGIDELSRIRKSTRSVGKEIDVNLEQIVLDSVKQRTEQFSKKQLSGLHKILLKLYREDRLDYSLNSFFNKFADSVVGVPERHRDRVLKGADKLLKMFPKRNTMGSMLLSYSKFLEESLEVLGDNLGKFIDKAMKAGKDADGVIAYLEDKHSYFEPEKEEVAGGLPLSQIYGRLLSYVQALSGKNIKLEKSQTSGLSCSFNGDTFFLPPVVNVSNNKENFQIYKSLASYQSGAIMFGTYSENLQKFFDSFKNQEFAKGLFEIMEFARLDSKLGEEFPGLRKDLRTFKDNYQAQMKKNGEETSLIKIRNYICQENEKDFSVLGELEFVFSEVQNLRKKSAKIKDTMASVKRAYKKLEKLVDLDVEKAPEKIIDVDVEFTPEERRVPSFLVAEPGEDVANGKRFRYDEWDCFNGAYKGGFVQVIETPYPDVTENQYVNEVVQADHVTIQRMREIFDTLRPADFVKMKKQRSGELDYDLWVRALAEEAAGITPSEKLYTKKFKNQRSVASMILSENSGSLGKFLDIDNPDLRLIDIVKRSQIYFSEALNAIEDNYALAAFSGETEQNVKFHLIKDFEQAYDTNVKNIVGSMKPLQQNRDAAGIRHATFLLSQQPEKVRFLFYLMEGLPHDFNYEGEYAIEDTKKAIIETKYNGCIPVVIAFGKEIDDKIRSLAGHCLYREISNPEDVPHALPDVYRRIAI